MATAVGSRWLRSVRRIFEGHVISYRAAEYIHSVRQQMCGRASDGGRKYRNDDRYRLVCSGGRTVTLSLSGIDRLNEPSRLQFTSGFVRVGWNLSH